MDLVLGVREWMMVGLALAIIIDVWAWRVAGPGA